MTQHLDLALSIDVPAGDGAPDGVLALDVRTFSVREEMNRPYEIELTAMSSSASLDLEEIVGATAQFRLSVRRDAESVVLGPAAARSWVGHVAEIHQLTAEVGGLSRYRVRLVPSLWLLTQKVDTRIFQHLSELEVALRVLSLWGIEPELRVDREAHLRREYRTQYEETDFDFVNRMLEEAGVSYFFESKDDGGGRMVVTDAAHRNRPRPRPLVHSEAPDVRGGQEWATDLQLARRVAPGRVTLTDHDFRKPPDVPILAEARDGRPLEQALDVYEFRDGHFLFIAGDAGDPEDPADTEAVLRTDERRARTLAVQRLRSQRGRARQVSFVCNAFDVETGDVVRIEGGPQETFARDGLLIVDTQLEGSWNTEWRLDLVAVSAADEYRPPMRTPRPVVGGVESATVVGPAGEEIHVDRHGRVKVHFHWDRDGAIDEFSSCWMHASQPWGGAGYGGTMLPRIGQEVLVGFFESDPDRPIIVGRYFTSLQQTPYRLPANKTRSGIKTNSTGGGGGFNELMFEDRGGQELLNMRAQRDMNLLVLNNRASTIQANESRHVGLCRIKTVGQTDSLTAGQDILLQAGNDYACTARKNLRMTATEQDLTATAVAGKVSVSGHTGVEVTSPTVVSLTVGPSSITLTPHGIVIDGPKVLINPGAAEKAAFLEDGTSPDQLEQRRAEEQQRAAAERQRQQRIAEFRFRTMTPQQRMEVLMPGAAQNQQRYGHLFRRPALPGLPTTSTSPQRMPLQPGAPFLLQRRSPPPGGP